MNNNSILFDVNSILWPPWLNGLHCERWKRRSQSRFPLGSIWKTNISKLDLIWVCVEFIPLLWDSQHREFSSLVTNHMANGVIVQYIVIIWLVDIDKNSRRASQVSIIQQDGRLFLGLGRLPPLALLSWLVYQLCWTIETGIANYIEYPPKAPYAIKCI